MKEIEIATWESDHTEVIEISTWESDIYKGDRDRYIGE